MSAIKSCGICCLGFSLFAIAFLLVVGAVINSGSQTIAIEEDKRDSAVKNCNVAAAIYAGFVALSILCIVLPARVCPPKKEDDSVDEFRMQ
jgi:hypothetical protein